MIRTVLPVPRRVNADPARRGKGVVLAFVDSGFSDHPDLSGRIRAYVDLEKPNATLGSDPGPLDWHGTQTSVVAAGAGEYPGIASEAELVLIRVGSGERIDEEAIAGGIEWAIRHRARFGIGILSVSVGGDEPRPLRESPASLAVEMAVREGIVVISAAGNSGASPCHWPIAPASAPSAITAGGYDDDNSLDAARWRLYPSSYGVTAEGIHKPDLLAPACWIAAPILRGSSVEREAELLLREEMRRSVRERLRQEKILSERWQHVDGTSMAAAIVTSVAAQLLEVNPHLTPSRVKAILRSTARRLPRVPALRQGAGVLDARAALRAALPQ